MYMWFKAFLTPPSGHETLFTDTVSLIPVGLHQIAFLCQPATENNPGQNITSSPTTSVNFGCKRQPKQDDRCHKSVPTQLGEQETSCMMNKFGHQCPWPTSSLDSIQTTRVLHPGRGPARRQISGENHFAVIHKTGQLGNIRNSCNLSRLIPGHPKAKKLGDPVNPSRGDDVFRVFGVHVE